MLGTKFTLNMALPSIRDIPRGNTEKLSCVMVLRQSIDFPLKEW